ncbi:MAG: ThuA domain-containing protein [Steroidobacteraceae bacterium]
MARIDVLLVCGGKYHDMDFARLELLKLLAEHEQIRVRVAEDFSNAAAIRASNCLVTYTCNVLPDEAGEAALRAFLETGGRWLALHGTNSVLKWSREHKAWDAPRTAPGFMQMLGSQFIAHPAISPYRVEISDPDDPLVADLEAFDADDELYLCEYHGDNHALLHTRFDGVAEGFVERDWRGGKRQLVLYRRRVGSGEILYCTLGHCRGRYDMQPLIENYPTVERGSWKLPVFYRILRRGIRWAARIDHATEAS